MTASVGVISVSEALYSTRRLLEAGRALGLDMRRIDPIRVLVHAGPGGPRLSDDGVDVPCPDVVIARIGAKLHEWGLAMLRALVDAGAASPVTPDAIRLAGDKLQTALRLAACGVRTVPTVAVREPCHVRDALAAVGGPPVVFKLLNGTQGQAVTVAPDQAGARATLELLVGLGHTVLVQPLLASSAPRDLRVLVVAGEPLAACWRVAAPGEFRSNVHRGGRALAAPLTDEAAALARAAAAALGLPLCGVDLIEAEGGLAVLEVNGSPGLEGIEAATGRDLATPILRSVLS